MNKNVDYETVSGFGNEWNRFEQNHNQEELKKIFNEYFSIFPFNEINKNSIGFDAGCGSGRWTNIIKSQVKRMDCIDPSIEALNVAKKKLKNNNNIIFYHDTIDNYFQRTNQRYDFGFSLGVLHHIPNIESSLFKINNKLIKDAPFLLYLYYNFENRNLLFKLIWKISNLLRIIISRLPNFIKNFICDLIALFIYYPLSRLNRSLKKLKLNITLPLSFYSDKSFYTMRTDSLDRFGTKLENRFSKKDIVKLLKSTGFKNIIFSNKEPFWVVLCYKD